MTFYMKTSFTKTVKEIINNLAQFLDEAEIHISPDGLTLNGLDSSRIMMFQLDIPSTFFYDYKVDSDDTIAIGVSMKDIKKYVSGAKTKDEIAFSLIQRDREFFGISLISGSVSRTFGIPILQAVDTETFDLSKMQPTVSVEISPPEFFKTIIEDAGKVGEDIHFITEKDNKKIRFESWSDLGGFYSLELDLFNSDFIVNFEIAEDATSIYALSYLKKIVKIAKVASVVRIQYAKNYPVILTFSFEQGARLISALAPRVY